MFTDECRCNVWNGIRQQDLRAFGKLLTDGVFAQAAEKAGVSLGKSALSLVQLVWLGISAAMNPLRNFADVLVFALKIMQDAPGWSATPLGRKQPKKQAAASKGNRSKRPCHDPYGTDPTRITEEAFVQARQRMPLAFWAALLVALGEQFQQQHAAWVRWQGFRLLAMDGTTIDLPAWQRLTAHFGTAKNGSSKGKTQARMVMLQMPLARMPWRYEVCPLGIGERTVAYRLLEHVGADDLVLLDQGFWSYGMFHQIARQKAFFAIRLPSHVRVHSLRRLGPKDRLVRWHKPTGPRWRGSDLPEDIDLRIIRYRLPGFRPSAVVTNMLDPHRVAAEDWVRLAVDTEAGDQRLGVGLYHRRWEIETTYYELKVTQGMEGNLRGRTPESVCYEIAGHVVLYLLTRWLMVEAAQRVKLDPLRLSFKSALNELLDIRHALITATPQRVAQVLIPRLLDRIASHQVPFRPGRHYPRPHDTQVKNCGNGKTKSPHKLRNVTSKA